MKRANESTQTSPRQLDIRSCLKLRKLDVGDTDACRSLHEQTFGKEAASKQGGISHVGQIIAAACNDHRVKELSQQKRMHDDWCEMVTRCARRPHVPSGHDVAFHDTDRTLYDRLNNAQKKAVVSPCSHALVILAGAGTGKTTTLRRKNVEPMMSPIHVVLQSCIESITNVRHWPRVLSML